MLKLITSCNDCDHYKVCNNVAKPDILYEQLRFLSVDDFGMDVKISCPDWEKSIYKVRSLECTDEELENWEEGK